MKKRGIIKFFNETKGFGFLIDEATGKEVFLHATGIVHKQNKPTMDDLVEYEEKDGPKGVMAVSIVKLG